MLALRGMVWDGLIDARNSLGIVSCAMIAALRRLVPVQVVAWPESNAAGVLAYASTPPVWPAYVTWPRHVWVRLSDPLSAHEGRMPVRVPYVYHESSFLASTVMLRLNQTTTAMCVMSSFQRQLMQGLGYKRPLVLVLNGVDCHAFRPRSRRKRAKTGPYTFISVGKLNRRKGSDLLIRAFQHAFSAHDDVRLILQTPNGWLEGRELIRHQNIGVIDRTLSRREMAYLLRSANCYVSATRSDASHLPGLEAMASGLSLIAPQFSGMQDYLHAAVVKIPLTISHRVAADGPGEWSEPDVEELVIAMREAARRRLDGWENAMVAKSRFTWAHSAGAMVAGISSVLG